MDKRASTAEASPRYRVVCLKLRGEHEEVVMDATGAGFVAAIGTIAESRMRGELASAGDQELQAHLALTIANDDQLAGRSRGVPR